jgi:hypothetical protein
MKRRGKSIDSYAVLLESCAGLDAREFVQRDDDGEFLDTRNPAILAAILTRREGDEPVKPQEE